MKVSSPCTTRKTTSSPSDAGNSVVNASPSTNAIASSQTSSNSLESKTSRELQGVITRSSTEVMNSSAVNLDDFSRAYVSLIRYLKAVWPNKEQIQVKKSSFTRNAGRKTSTPKARLRALELQLKRQQEKISFDWHSPPPLAPPMMDFNNFNTCSLRRSRVHKFIDPYGHIDAELDLSHLISSNHSNISSNPPLESFHNSPPLQQAK